MMDSDLIQFAKRFVAGYGIADCVPESCAERLTHSSADRDAPLQFIDATTDVRSALHHLSILSWPATRHVAFSAPQGGTAFINNSRHGSDYADQKVWLARSLQSRFARIVNQQAKTWINGSEREVMKYDATIFELFDRNGELIRCVTCMNDGNRWVFHESGDRHPIESSFPYDAARKRDRFGPAQLTELAAAFNISTIQPSDLLGCGRYYLFKSPFPPRHSCTLAEADDPAYAYYKRGLTWVSRMETHASSVVADFERCVQLNPDYEPKVREALDRAYAILDAQKGS